MSPADNLRDALYATEIDKDTLRRLNELLHTASEGGILDIRFVPDDAEVVAKLVAVASSTGDISEFIT